MDEPKTFRSKIQADAIATSRAKQLRRTLTPPECRLWLAIKAKKLNGLHFRKQVAIGPYIADFYCHAARLVVEVDGSHHDPIADHRRNTWMEGQGIRVVRFAASDVRDHLEHVLTDIRRKCEEQIRLRSIAKTPSVSGCAGATSPGSPGEES